MKATVNSTGWRVLLAPVALVLALAMYPLQASAVDCAVVLAGPADALDDFDQDGFTDFQECLGINLAVSGTLVQSCVASSLNPAPPTDRNACLHPDTRDVFIVYNRPANTLLSQLAFPFDTSETRNNFYGIQFRGLAALGVTVHQLAPDQIGTDRIVSATSSQKAIRVTESLDASGAVLGYCQWGTPMDLDGCTVFTQRAKNSIASACGTTTIFTPTGATFSGIAESLLMAYSTYLILHETGHTMGGLTPNYDSRFGGYHYKAGSKLVMEQAVTYSVKGGKCTFYISPVWNAMDAPSVRLR